MIYIYDRCLRVICAALMLGVATLHVGATAYAHASHSHAPAAPSPKDRVGSSHINAKASAVIINNDAKAVGTLHIRQGNEGIIIELNVKDMPSGKHGMHFHEVGTCDDADAFKHAKGHIMPTGKPHGFLHPQGPHEGNLPNLIVAQDGRAHVELYSELLSLNGHGDKPALLDADGSALIIHAEPDDHLTQPIGGSGARIACAVISAME